jgi:hypothetical protein
MPIERKAAPVVPFEEESKPAAARLRAEARRAVSMAVMVFILIV